MTHTTEWFIVSETHASDLVCQRRHVQVDKDGHHIKTHWQEVVGPVMIITEYQFRVNNDNGTIGELCDTRTRLVVRAVDAASGNGSEYGITPSVIDDNDDDRQYRQFIFTSRRSMPTQATTSSDSPE